MNKDDSNELTVRSIDYITSVVKSFVGAVPIVGPFLCEVAGNLIPKQRIERLSKFAEKLADRLRGSRKMFCDQNSLMKTLPIYSKNPFAKRPDQLRMSGARI